MLTHSAESLPRYIPSTGVVAIVIAIKGHCMLACNLGRDFPNSRQRRFFFAPSRIPPVLEDGMDILSTSSLSQFVCLWRYCVKLLLLLMVMHAACSCSHVGTKVSTTRTMSQYVRNTLLALCTPRSWLLLLRSANGMEWGRGGYYGSSTEHARQHA